jgi:hypothetical protein
VYWAKFLLGMIRIKHKQQAMAVPTNRHKIWIHGNSERHTSVVDICVGKGPFCLDLWGAGIRAEHSQGYVSASHIFWKLIQALLSHHETINRHCYALSSLMDEYIVHGCNNGCSVWELPLITTQRWSLPEAIIRFDAIEESAELKGRAPPRTLSLMKSPGRIESNSFRVFSGTAGEECFGIRGAKSERNVLFRGYQNHQALSLVSLVSDQSGEVSGEYPRCFRSWMEAFCSLS